MATEMKATEWQAELLKRVRQAVASDPEWGSRLEAVSYAPCTSSVHLAIFTEPYLQYVMDGRKTVESRFGVHRCAPHGKVKQGDIVILKRAGGPVLGLCQVTYVWFYELDPCSWTEIKAHFMEALCAQDPNFWVERQAATYATLMRIDHVLRIEPIVCDKRDRRGWVVLTPKNCQLEMEALVP